MQLVFLALEIVEKAANSRELAFAFNHLPALLGLELGPGDIERNVGLLGEAFELGEERSDIWAWSRDRLLLRSETSTCQE